MICFHFSKQFLLKGWSYIMLPCGARKVIFCLYLLKCVELKNYLRALYEILNLILHKGAHFQGVFIYYCYYILAVDGQYGYHYIQVKVRPYFVLCRTVLLYYPSTTTTYHDFGKLWFRPSLPKSAFLKNLFWLCLNNGIALDWQHNLEISLLDNSCKAKISLLHKVWRPVLKNWMK